MSPAGLLRSLCPVSVFVWAASVPALAASPYPNSTVITGVNFNWSTHIRLAPGSDNWPITWADNDHQYSSWGDGGGFGGTNTDGRVSLGFARIEGPQSGYTGYNVWGGKNPENPATFDGKSYGIISIGGVLYAWRGPGSNTTSYDEARLYKSTDHAASWSATSVAFVKADDLVMPTILNFGKDYAGARDNYVYHYFIELQGSPTSLNVHIPGRIHLLRVDKSQIETKSAYEFFSGTSASPAWSSSLASSRPVFEDAAGVGWNLSVSYNAGLQRYLLCTEHTATFQGRLGLFDAPEPWGPWTTVTYAEGTAVFGAGSIQASTFFWNFSNKWLSPDGLSFVLVFSGINDNDSWNTVEGSFTAVPPNPPDPAVEPSPANGAVGVSVQPILEWTPGARATSHDVYFGTVNPPGPAEFRGNQAAATHTPEALTVHRTYYWRIDEVNSTGTTTGTIWNFTTRYGDFDGDGDVDQKDFGHFQACCSGSGEAQTDQNCLDAILDGDEDVDQYDFALFISCLSGAGNPVGPSCGQ